MPAALMVSGRAKVILAERASKDARNSQLLLAGLDFMRVACFHPYSDQAAEALYQAGQACAAAGDVNGAKVAYDAAATRYADTDWGKKAGSALGSLK
jgi:TolA-binding protein